MDFTVAIFIVLAAAADVTSAGKIIDVNVTYQGGGTSDTYENAYCVTKGRSCDLGNQAAPPKFQPTIDQCLALCNRNEKCVTVYFGKDKDCFLLNKRCEKSELVSAMGSDYYRLERGEKCPGDRPLYTGHHIKYSTKFCMMEGQRCPGHDLYKKPQNIKPMMKCLEKCARIKSCASVDFINNKCSPKSYHCKDSELVKDEYSLNFERLVEGNIKCADNRVPPPTEAIVAPTTPVPTTSTRTTTTTAVPTTTGKPAEPCVCNSHRTDKGECDCDRGFEKVGAQCRPLCHPTEERDNGGVCDCKKRFERVGRQCLPVCTSTETRDDDGVCRCKPRHQRVGHLCLADCQENAGRDGTECRCFSGYQLVKNACMKETQVTTPKPGVECERNNDLVFLVDASRSIKKDEWAKVIQYLVKVIGALNFSQTRIGLAYFNRRAQQVYNVRTQDKQQMIDFLTSWKQPGDRRQTRIDLALDLGKRMLLQAKSRDGRQQTIVLVTDGATYPKRYRKSAVRQAQSLGGEGIKLLLVAIGIRKKDLRQIHSLVSQDTRRIVSINDFYSLNTEQHIQSLTGKIACDRQPRK